MDNQWNISIEEAAREIGDESAVYEWLHKKSAEIILKYMNKLTLISGLLSAFGGGGGLTGLLLERYIDNPLIANIFTIFGIVLTVAAAVISVILRIRDYPSVSESHNEAAARYNWLHYKIQAQLQVEPQNRQNGLDFYDWITYVLTGLSNIEDIEDDAVEYYKDKISEIIPKIDDVRKIRVVGDVNPQQSIETGYRLTPRRESSSIIDNIQPQQIEYVSEVSPRRESPPLPDELSEELNDLRRLSERRKNGNRRRRRRGNSDDIQSDTEMVKFDKKINAEFATDKSVVINDTEKSLMIEDSSEINQSPSNNFLDSPSQRHRPTLVESMDFQDLNSQQRIYRRSSADDSDVLNNVKSVKDFLKDRREQIISPASMTNRGVSAQNSPTSSFITPSPRNSPVSTIRPQSNLYQSQTNNSGESLSNPSTPKRNSELDNTCTPRPFVPFRSNSPPIFASMLRGVNTNTRANTEYRLNYELSRFDTV